jgi:hypothetical protein
MRPKIAILIPSLLLGIATSGVAAQGRGQKKQESSAINVNVTFGSDEHRIIREWFAHPANLSGLPPGLAKKEQLPPGLQRQLVRNGELPPGLQKKVHPLPHALEVQLPRLPEGRRRVIISGSVVLLDSPRNTILDVFAAF